MKLFRRIVSLLLVLLLAISFVACGAGESSNDDAAKAPSSSGGGGGNGGGDHTVTPPTLGGEFVLGMSAPLTGAAAAYGQAVRNAAQMAVDEINAAGGLYGATFKLLVSDDVHSSDNVANIYQMMKEQGMQVSLGAVTSLPCLEFSALARNDNLFLLTPSASSMNIPNGENAYQMCIGDEVYGRLAAEYVNGMEIDKVGILYDAEDSYYSIPLRNQFKDALSDDIAVVEAACNSWEYEFSPQIEALSGCDVVFLPLFYPSAANFLIHAQDRLSPDVLYLGCDGLDGLAEHLETQGETVSRTVCMVYSLDVNATEGETAEFIGKYTEAYGNDTAIAFAALGYDAVYAIYEAMKTAIDEGNMISTDISASELCEILEAQFQGGFTFSGITGENITWDANGFADKDPIVVVIDTDRA